MPEPVSEDIDNSSENTDTNTQAHNVRLQRERRPPQVLTYMDPEDPLIYAQAIFQVSVLQDIRYRDKG